MPNHSANIPWPTFEARLVEFAQKKLTNRDRRKTEGDRLCLGSELSALREFYLWMHAQEFPNDLCGVPCWKEASDVAYAEMT